MQLNFVKPGSAKLRLRRAAPAANKGCIARHIVEFKGGTSVHEEKPDEVRQMGINSRVIELVLWQELRHGHIFNNSVMESIKKYTIETIYKTKSDD